MKNANVKALNISTRLKTLALLGAAGAGGLASAAAGDTGVDFGAIATSGTATIVAAAAAGAGVLATGIGVRIAFRWATRLIK